MPPRSDHAVYPSDRPILPASEVKPQPTPDGVHRGSVLVEPFKQLPKRKQVTAVACRPCKARKSKCNGDRPTCMACIKRGQPLDCEYDMASDQRRTTALKERIQELRKENDDLKAIIGALAHDHGDTDIHRTIEALVLNGFLDVGTAAQLVKESERAHPSLRGKVLPHTVDNSIVYGTNAMSITSMSSTPSPTATWTTTVTANHQLVPTMYPQMVSYPSTDSASSPDSNSSSNNAGNYWGYQRLT